MNFKTNLLEEYVNFVDLTKKQNKYFEIIIDLIAIIMFLFLFLVLQSRRIQVLERCSYTIKNI